MTYAEKLKDPRWQRLRLKVFERDSWACQVCRAKDKPLACHHWHYEKGLEPWEADPKTLQTVCESCHLEIEKQIRETNAALSSKNLARALVKTGLPLRTEAGQLQIWLVATGGPLSVKGADRILDVVFATIHDGIAIAREADWSAAMETAGRPDHEAWR